MASDTSQAAPAAPAEPPSIPSPAPQAAAGSGPAPGSPPSTRRRPPKAAAPSAAPRQPQRQLSLSDPNLRTCFICLQNSNETPDAGWVNPCPCTLEAHELCLLRWVAETEGSAVGGKKKLRCPACNGRIYVVEPWDPVVKFRQRMNRLYSRVSPALLLSILYSMGVAGSGFFGLFVLQVFAGPAPAARWLWRDVLFRRSSPGAGFVFALKIFLLHLIAPGLLLHRALGGLLSVVTVPASFVYGATLVWRDHMPTWPPSPAWALTLLPYLNVTYNSVYWEFFGPTERRFNSALRGRPTNDEPRPDGQPGNAPAAEQQEDGIGTLIWRLGHAVLNIFDGNEDGRLEGGAGEGEGEAAGGGLRVQLELVVEDGDDTDEDGNQVPAAEAEPQTEPLRPPEQPGNQQDEGAEQIPADGRAEEVEQRDGRDNEPAGVGGAQEQPEQDEAQEAGHQPVEQDNRVGPTLSDIVNATVTQLLFPFLSAGIGGALYLTLPRTWVNRAPGRPPTGLLQERWGRSIVGGCVFIVLRDAANLYTKYRRVQVKKHRKVRDQGRRAAGSSSS